MGGAILYAHGNQDVSPSDHQELVVLCSTSCHRNLHWLTASVQPELQGYGQGILSPLLPCAVRLTQYFLPIKQLYLYLTPPYLLLPLPSSILSPSLPLPLHLSLRGIEWINQFSFISYACSSPNASGNVRNETVAVNIQTG